MKKFVLSIALVAMTAGPSLAQADPAQAAKSECTKSKAQVVATQDGQKEAAGECPLQAAKKAEAVATQEAKGDCHAGAKAKVASDKAKGCCADKAKAQVVSAVKGDGTSECSKAKAQVAGEECEGKDKSECSKSQAQVVSTTKGDGCPMEAAKQAKLAAAKGAQADCHAGAKAQVASDKAKGCCGDKAKAQVAGDEREGKAKSECSKAKAQVVSQKADSDEKADQKLED
jgi:hypothetical protein